MTAQVLSPREAAEVLGVHHTTIRRWVAAGACPDVFAALPGTRVGIPRWWVEERINTGRQIPSPAAVGGGGEGGPAVALATHGGPQLRSIGGVAPPSVA